MKSRLIESILANINEEFDLANKITKEFESYQPIVNEVCKKLFSKYESEELIVEYQDCSSYKKYGPYTGCFVRFSKNYSRYGEGTCAVLSIGLKHYDSDEDEEKEKEFNSGIRYISLETYMDIEKRVGRRIIGKINKDDINETSLYNLCVDSEPYKEIDEEVQAYLGKSQEIKKDYGKGLDSLKQRLENSNLFYNIEIDNCDYDEIDYSVVVNTQSGDWIGREESEMMKAIKDSGYKYKGSEEVESGVYEAFFNN